MNVWIVNPFDNLPFEGNRPQRYWLMAEAFARVGHRILYWTSDFSHATKRQRSRLMIDAGEADAPEPPGNAERAEGIEVVQIPTMPYDKNVCWARVRSHRKLARDFERMALERARNGESALPPELVIASTPPLGLCAAAMRVAKDVGAKFVCDIQDAWPETFERLLPWGLKWTGGIVFAPMFKTARKLYREADLVTGVCARYAKLSGRDDFHLAYLGIGRSEGANDGHREDVGGRTGRASLVYVGNLGTGYDLETVIAAVAKRAGLTLDIAGMGPQEERLRSKVGRLDLGGRVRFHGYLGRTELSDLLAHCEVGVIPMRDDSWVGLPNKLTDYLSAGLQVISSLHGECGDLLARTRFGRVYDWGSVESLLAALDALSGVDVSLPAELCAESIYSKYVARMTNLVSIPDVHCLDSR